MVVASAARTQARSLEKDFWEQFNAETRESQETEEFSPRARLLAKATVPLSRMAARKGGLCGREVTKASTDSAPADSPKIVTFSGFPPKAHILCWTHRKAAL